MSLSLVVLAAGVGSRYGGPKQIDRVGPGGSTLIDYAAYDARQAGFERLILVVREGKEAEMREAVGDRIARRFPVAYAVQPTSGRAKPWGTGHATLAAAALVDGPFAVVNADDFYGASSYLVLARHLKQAVEGGTAEHALVGYPLSDTLSPDGPVSRAACTVDESGYLTSIRELVKIERDGKDARFLDDDGTWRPLPGETPVSLNFWGFTLEAKAVIERGFREFLARNAASASAEYYVVSAVQSIVDEGRSRVRVLGGGGPWAGLTHPGDRPRLASLLASLTASGVYPPDLWA